MSVIAKTRHDPYDLRILAASREALRRSSELLRITRPALEGFAGIVSRDEPSDTQREGERACGAGRMLARDDVFDRSPDV
jgi:hypothetical protein